MQMSIKFKLLLLMILTMLIPISISSYLYYQNILSEYEKDAFKSTKDDFKIINMKLESHIQKLTILSNNLVKNRSIISTVNLISNYEDKNNYNKILFDEQKKQLLDLMHLQLKLKENISFAIFNKNSEIMVMRKRLNGKDTYGFVSYNKGKAEFIDISKGEKFLEIPKHKNVLLVDKGSNLVLDQDGFGLVYFQKIYLDGEFIGEIRLKELFDKSNIDMFSQSINHKFSFLCGDLILGNFTNIDKKFILKNSTKYTKNHILNELSENSRNFFHIHSLDTVTKEKLYLISSYNKKILISKIDDLKRNIFISIVFSVIITFFITILFLQKSILIPLKKLMIGINSLKENRFQPIILEQNDELGKIADEFNLLATSLKNSFTEIEKSKALMRNIIDNAPIRVFWKDKNSIYMGANKLFLQDSNILNEEDIIGKSDFEQSWKNDAKLYVDRDKEVMSSQKPIIKSEETKTAPDGSTLYLLVSKIPLINECGEVIGIVGIYDDISLQKNLINEMRQKDKQMFHQSRLAQMGEMMSMIAHQWRQPLNAISARSANMLIKAQLGKLTDDLVVCEATHIDSYSQHLSQTINDFRDFFKPNKEIKEVNFGELINSAVSIVETSLINKNINISQNLNCVEKFKTYPNEIKQVILNLIKNAEDVLLDKKIINPFIEISTCKENKNYILEVSDNGGGVPLKIIDHIFDPYFSTKLQKDGTGLGLYMSKTIIEEHCKGELTVRNSRVGAIFRITL